MQRNDLVGQRFNRLVVIGIHSICAKKNIKWQCKCDCGGNAVAYAHDLRSGKVKSCKCLVRDGMNTTHGFARRGRNRSKVYSVWAAMMQRCSNPNDKNYFRYGGRGIQVCDRWGDFENFLCDMGEPLNGRTIERLDNNKGYEPQNCVWASHKEQLHNTRANIKVFVGRKEMVLAEALRHTKAHGQTIYRLMKKFNLTHQEGIDLWLERKKVL